jgi:predicted O-methyltransferase YrrM
MFTYEHEGKEMRPVPGFLEELASYIPDTAKHFLEWGGGCSTLYFQELARKQGGTSLTLEHDLKFFTSIARKMDFDGAEIILQNLEGPRESQKDQGLNYATYPLSREKKFDVILIDGRRRVECAVAALLCAHKDTVILMHDYRRLRYQLVNIFYDVEDGAQFRKLIPKIKGEE